MVESEPSFEEAPDGNIFAHILNQILTSRGYRLGLIDNRTDIHAQKVARLQHSLHDPTRVHLLNPEDLGKVVEAFGIAESETDILRLRAAVLAASIQKTLLDRIASSQALLAVRALFPVIYDALRTSSHREPGLGDIRGPDLSALEDITSDGVFTGVLDAMDRATIALQLADFVQSSLERILQLREARDCFQVARLLLEEMPPQIRSTADWQFWHTDAERGHQSVAERLEDEDIAV